MFNAFLKKFQFLHEGLNKVFVIVNKRKTYVIFLRQLDIISKGEKPYKYNLCSTSFARKTSLTQYKKNSFRGLYQLALIDG